MRILDYGCGAGTIVGNLRQKTLDAFGCDVFYEGGDRSGRVNPEYFKNRIIRKIENGKIPFEDASFDLVINNQVFEHVEDLDAVLAEVARVLKPGGQVLSLFPDASVIREGHCGIPFLHWFPKSSRPRVYYAALLRSLGLGYHKGDKSIMAWSHDFCLWLDNWTHYRSLREIHRLYAKHHLTVEHIEDDWLRTRWPKLTVYQAFVPDSAQRLFARKLGCLVFTATRSQA
jgi:SAM-dependent methyltransferase